MKEVKFSLIFENLNSGKYLETEAMCENDVIETIKHCKKRGINVLGMNKIIIEKEFISNSDISKYGYE